MTQPATRPTNGATAAPAKLTDEALRLRCLELATQASTKSVGPTNAATITGDAATFFTYVKSG